ncbi:hypothetical protein BH10PLA1_BH10PLA1_22400 [soil metagenome]
MPAGAPKARQITAGQLRLIAPVLIVLAVVYAYSNAYKGLFFFDDQLAIVANPSIRTLWPIWTPMVAGNDGSTAGRPLVGLSFAINYAIDGLNPRGYHVGNVGLHAMSALVLWDILRRLLRRLNHPAAAEIALATALIWATHPLLTDAVTYIVNRTEVLMALFVLLTIDMFLRALESAHPRRWLALSIACNIAAAMSKEVGVMAGPIVLMIDALVISCSWTASWRLRWGYYAALLSVWILPPLLLASISIASHTGNSDRVSAWQYLMMQSQIIPMYLRLSFWPHPLVICYVDWPVPTSIVQVLPQMLCVAGLVLLTAYFAIRRRAVALFGIWFFLILAPSSSFIPIASEPAGERRMYLPLAAIVLATILLVNRFLQRVSSSAMMRAVMLAIVVFGLGQLTLYRNEDYTSDLAMWADTVHWRPGNPRAQNYLAAALMDRGDFAGALECVDRALNVAPGFLAAVERRGLIMCNLGRWDEAMQIFNKAVLMNPKDPVPQAYVALVLMNQGHADQANAIWDEILRQHPGDVTVKEMIAKVRG